MKRLFMVGSGKDVLYFEKKDDAKAFAYANKLRWQLGPDHWRYGLAPASRRTHSHNMRAGGPGTGFKKRAK